MEQRPFWEVMIIQGKPFVLWRANTSTSSTVCTSGGNSEPTTVPMLSVSSRVLEGAPQQDESLAHVDGTYDTYICKDCNFIIPCLQRGNPALIDHIRHGDAKCRHVEKLYEGLEHELLLIKAMIRFQGGCLAFPEYILYSDKLYVVIHGTRHCVICGQPSSAPHYPACAVMLSRAKASLRYLRLNVKVDDNLMFPSNTLEPIPCSAMEGALGEPANMKRVSPDSDEHACSECGVSVYGFVQGDTLMGEHIFHCYNEKRTCPYIEKIFAGKGPELTRKLAYERYRKGYVAYPNHLIESAFGLFRTVMTTGFVDVCLVCGSPLVQLTDMPDEGHFSNCRAMVESLRLKLRKMKYLWSQPHAQWIRERTGEKQETGKDV